MQVVIINESAKKALVRSRRILSKYLPQLGGSTWAGRISEEGLEDLHKKLKACASKSTSIACHRIATRSRLELAWIVGSKACFGEDGRYAFRQTQAKKLTETRAPAARSALQRYCSALLRLAGLLHDTGKSSLAFSKKLYVGQGFEAIRHDLLGFLILAESLLKPDVTDASWLSLLAQSPEKACSSVDLTAGTLLPPGSAWLERVTRASQEVDSPVKAAGRLEHHLLNSSELEPLADNAPGLLAVLWLTLSHHRLPAGAPGDKLAERLGMQDHLNRTVIAEGAPKKKDWFIGGLKECLTPAPGQHPWQDPAWLTSVKAAAQAALDVLPSVPKLSPQVWAQLIAHRMRPVLMTADQHAAWRCNQGPRKTKKPAHVYANTHGSETYGDTLSEHELRVARTTRLVQHLLTADLPCTSVPEDSVARTASLPPAFKWQRELELSIVQARGIGPAFVSIIAETGAGKTLGALRAANALAPEKLRLTVALGLRSLTKQTADAFVEDAKLPACDVMLAVGQPQTLNLIEKLQQAADSATAEAPAGITGVPGSESTLTVDEDTLVTRADEREEDRFEWLAELGSPQELAGQWGLKTLNMLTAPVLACTADHLTGGASLLAGSNKTFIRAATSDLVLDEIDSYSAKDLQTIAKLAFTFGSYGRNVIVMSATMSPEVQKGLYRAWRAGLAVYEALQGTPLAYAAVFASNTDGAELLESPDQEAAEAAWLRFVERVCESYEARTARRRVLEVLELPAAKGDVVHEALLQGALGMHKDFKLVDPKTGKQVSVGFVRFNVTRSAREMGAYLAARPPRDDEPDVRFVVYHAKYPRSYLAVLDATLGPLTKRKDPHAFLDTPALRWVLDTSDKQEVMVVVCTTTLIETGRDFDFDWAILEPREQRGEVQAVGRVRRHRAGCVDAPNVLMLDKPLKALKGGAQSQALWGFPGIEDTLEGLKVTKPLPKLCGGVVAKTPAFLKPKPPEPVVLAVDALPLEQWRGKFDAQTCLRPSGDAQAYGNNRLGYLAQFVERVNLSQGFTGGQEAALPVAVSTYLDSMLPLNSNHARATQFRDSAGSTESCLFRPGAALTFWDTRTQSWLKLQHGKTIPCSGAKALIPDIEAQAATVEGSEDPHIVGCALRSKQADASQLNLEWSALLGFNVAS